MTLTEARAKEMELTTLLSDDMPEEEYDKIAVKRNTLSSQIAMEESRRIILNRTDEYADSKYTSFLNQYKTERSFFDLTEDEIKMIKKVNNGKNFLYDGFFFSIIENSILVQKFPNKIFDWGNDYDAGTGL